MVRHLRLIPSSWEDALCATLFAIESFARLHSSPARLAALEKGHHVTVAFTDPSNLCARPFLTGQRCGVQLGFTHPLGKLAGRRFTRSTKTPFLSTCLVRLSMRYQTSAYAGVTCSQGRNADCETKLRSQGWRLGRWRTLFLCQLIPLSTFRIRIHTEI